MKKTKKRTTTNCSHQNSTSSDYSFQAYESSPHFSPYVQPKLKIGQPNDKYEQEADAMADKVMRMPDDTIQRAAKPKIEEEEKIQMKTAGKGKAPKEEEELLQTKPIMMKSEGGESAATPALATQLNSTKGSGKSLAPDVNASMSNAFGTDFSHVRVHTDTRATQMNQDLNAKAFTHGSDVYFNQGQYAPTSSQGKKLLAHELTHVIQQDKSKNQIQRRVITGTPITNKDKRAPGDWYLADQIQWQNTSVGGYIKHLPQKNSFILACIYNTRNLRPNEYTNVQQRHNYYDLISYVIQHDPNTPAALKKVKFFHATSFVTSSPGIGSVDSPAGAAMLKQDTRIILREVNVGLFAENMKIIKKLLFEWKEPRSPKNEKEKLSAFEFDMQMVEFEQQYVEDYIQRNISRFTSDIKTDINDTIDPETSGQCLNPTIQPMKWALKALNIKRLNFTNMEHRRAIGFASVHIFHKKTIKEYLKFMQQRTVVRKKVGKYQYPHN